MKLSSVFLALAITTLAAQAADSKTAGKAINALGVDLYRALSDGEDNLLLSPYSIQSALAMTFAGADGDTRTEMKRVLHFPADDTAVHGSFKSLADELTALKTRSLQWVKQAKGQGGPSTPIELTIANRLFAQKGYPFRPAFLSLVKESYDAPLDEMDFRKAPEPARAAINRWIANKTKDRIRDIIPPGAIKPDTRLVLANALYLRAPWASEFSTYATKKERFLVHGREGAEVPMMTDTSDLGYAKRDGFQIVTRRYYGGELRFVILLPDEPTGLATVKRVLSPELLQQCTELKEREVILHLPKFRIEPPTVPLADTLKKLGMKTAFNEPEGSANFDRIAPRKPDDYLYIGAVLHKTFLALDEKGTEAAAATVVDMPAAAGIPEQKPKPIEIRIDHPFLFAIQHVPSGACLFLGRVTDPR